MDFEKYVIEFFASTGLNTNKILECDEKTPDFLIMDGVNILIELKVKGDESKRLTDLQKTLDSGKTHEYITDLGLGVEQDRKKGFELYAKSANLGWAEAMWNLSNVFGAGNLGEKDLYSACVWSPRAKKYAKPNDARLNTAIERIVPYLEQTLTSDDFEKCENEADAWKPQQNLQ